MIRELAFWAQALDNLSADEMEIREEDLSRDQVASLSTSVARSGTKIYNEVGVQLVANDHLFVLEVPCAQRDQAGRIAPIVCFGEYNFGGFGDEDRGELVVKALNEFANHIGRTIEARHCDIVQEAFSTLEKRAKAPVLAEIKDFAAKVKRALTRTRHP
jgi:hypothetical protein